MCGRFKFVSIDEEAAAAFGVPFVPPNPRYNIAPTQRAATVRVAPAGGREWADLRWGLVPFFSKDASGGARLINARSETVAERPAFRDAFRRRRCLVPADGFYEWSAPEDGRRRPFLIRRVDRRTFAFAGLWERWSPDGEEALETFTILTTSPNAVVGRLHDRMPVVLPRDAFGPWLDPDLRDPAALRSFLAPAPDAEWEALPVGHFVNRPTLDAPVCAEPLAGDDPTDPANDGQMTLL